MSYSRIIEARLHGERDRAVPRVFARPLALQAGQNISQTELIARLNRELRALANNGVIQQARREILILNLEWLRDELRRRAGALSCFGHPGRGVEPSDGLQLRPCLRFGAARHIERGEERVDLVPCEELLDAAGLSCEALTRAETARCGRRRRWRSRSRTW